MSGNVTKIHEAKISGQIPLDLEVLTVQGKENFHVGRSNQEAVGWIERWPNWPAPALILTGPAASGKSHLSAAWANHVAEKAGCGNNEEVMFVRPEMLLSREASDIAETAKNLVIESLDLWIGDRAAETTLFHLYNIFKEENRSMILSARMAPAHMDFVVKDLASRLRAAPVAAIHAPDDMLLGSVLIKQFSDRQLSVSNDVIKYILPRMERSFVAARDIVVTADKMALAQKSKISVPLMRQVLAILQND